MNQDEVISDIQEKIEKISDIVNNLRIEQSRHRDMIERHELREIRIALLEKNAQFFRNFVMIISSVGTILLFFATVYRYTH